MEFSCGLHYLVENKEVEVRAAAAARDNSIFSWILYRLTWLKTQKTITYLFIKLFYGLHLIRLSWSANLDSTFSYNLLTFLCISRSSAVEMHMEVGKIFLNIVLGIILKKLNQEGPMMKQLLKLLANLQS